MGRLLAWGFAVLMFGVPLNWVRLWKIGDIASSATLSQFIIGTLVCWGLCGATVFLLFWTAKSNKAKAASDQQELEELLTRPLTPIRPRQAIIKPDEQAYASINANLQGTGTVGYKAGSSGVSVRVAKGITLRSGGSRRTAIKGAVTIASGELVVTDKRVVFAGDKKSFVIPLADLINTTNYIDGFGFSNEKATYTLVTSGGSERILFASTLDKLLRQ